MGMFENLKTLTGNPYNQCQYDKDLADTTFLRQANEWDIVLPTASEPDRTKYFGAFVFTPKAGLHDHSAYLDLASMYPNITRTLNASPETLIGMENDLANSPYSREDCRWGYVDTRPVKRLTSDESYSDFADGTYKMVYDPNSHDIKWRDDPQYERCYFVGPELENPFHEDKEGGFVPEKVDEFIDYKYQYDGSMYSAAKMTTNAVGYGVLGDEKFRLYDWKIAESITLTGRKIIEHTAETAVKRLKTVINGDVYVALGDTDGCAITAPCVGTRGHFIPLLEDAVDHLNNDGYNEFMRHEFGCDTHHMEVELESYAPRVFVPSNNPPHGDEGVKKTYAQWITLDDYEEVDEISITGFEAKRSDVADITIDVQKDILEAILRRDRQDAKGYVYELIRDVTDRFMDETVKLDELGKRQGIGQALSEYGSEHRSASTHPRGAKYAENNIEGEDIGQGSKPMVFYIKSIVCDCDDAHHPSTYSTESAEDGSVVDAISVEDVTNLPDCVEIDYEKHLEKTVYGPIRPIIQTMGWKIDEMLHGHEQKGLAAFE